MQIDLFAAFFAGLASFLAPCTIAAVPIFLAYFSSNYKNSLKAVTSYSIGFVGVLVLLGIGIAEIGKTLHFQKEAFVFWGGIMIILLGLFMLFGEKIPRLNFLFQTKKIVIDPKKYGNTLLTPFLIGATNAFSWTPCLGPVLATILSLAANSATAIKGGILLAMFGLGVTLPLFVFAFFYSKLGSHFKSIQKYSNIIYKISAIIVIIIGLLFVSGLWDNFQLFITDYFDLEKFAQ